MRYYIPARETEIQIDLDHGGKREFHRRLGILRGLDLVKIVKVVETPSKTKGHWHMTVQLEKPLEANERILLAACLGSDPVRELLNWARTKKGDPFPILFIEPIPQEHEVRLRIDADEDMGWPFADESEPEGELSCDCALGAGRCKHMEEFQPALVFVDYRPK